MCRKSYILQFFNKGNSIKFSLFRETTTNRGNLANLPQHSPLCAARSVCTLGCLVMLPNHTNKSCLLLIKLSDMIVALSFCRIRNDSSGLRGGDSQAKQSEKYKKSYQASNLLQRVCEQGVKEVSGRVTGTETQAAGKETHQEAVRAQEQSKQRQVPPVRGASLAENLVFIYLEIQVEVETSY